MAALLPGLHDEGAARLCFAWLPVACVARCRALSKLHNHSLNPFSMLRLKRQHGIPCEQRVMCFIQWLRGPLAPPPPPPPPWLELDSDSSEEVLVSLDCIVIHPQSFACRALQSRAEHFLVGPRVGYHSRRIDALAVEPGQVWVRGLSKNFHTISFSPFTSTWTQGCAAMIQQDRSSFAWAASGASVYVAGGYGSWNNESYNSAERFDVRSRMWQRLPDWPRRLSLRRPHRPQGALIDGCFHVLEAMAPSQSYDPNTNTWSVGDIMGPTNAINPIAVLRGDIYTMDYDTYQLLRFNRASRTWVSLGRLWMACHPERMYLLPVGQELWLFVYEFFGPTFVYSCTPHANSVRVQWFQLPIDLPFEEDCTLSRGIALATLDV